MLFVFFSNADVKFAELRKFTCRSYNTPKALPIICCKELIDKIEFAKAVLNKNLETFIMHVLALETTTIHPF